METLEEQQKKQIMKYYVRFCNGEQYIKLNTVTLEIEEEPKKYYWEERQVYNHILPFVELLQSKYETKFEQSKEEKEIFLECIFGVNGFVSKVISYQKDYNNLKNKEKEYIEKITNPILFVEDGSIDIDNLEVEGLAPGKILVYRNGATPPKNVFEFDYMLMEILERKEQETLEKMEKIYEKQKEIFEDILAIKENKNETNN